MFCFIFVALFVGLYKSGMLYSAKERAIRSGNLTALSAGAVYANGMQLVRLTNAILLGFAIADLIVITAALDLTGGLSLVLPPGFKDPNFRGKIQTIQNILFGIKGPLPGVYPLLIFGETVSVANQNGLKNTWPTTNPLSWSMPIPPSPILVFNITTIGPSLAQAIIPNMALKFRMGDYFLNAVPKEKKTYRLKNKKTGKVYYYKQDQVEIATNSQNQGQMRVKKGSGLENEGKYVAEEVSAGLSKLNSLIKLANVLASLKLDVTDRDIPAIHNVFVYADYPTSIPDPQNNNATIHTLSQINVTGTGLAAWNIGDQPYQTTLAPTDPIELVKQISIQSLVSQLFSAGKFPSFSDVTKVLTNGPI
ncbi:MAG TPA: hypothetical protein VK791_04645 [bacterium]|nr:hypothetical protein [bacterium]